MEINETSINWHLDAPEPKIAEARLAIRESEKSYLSSRTTMLAFDRKKAYFFAASLATASSIFTPGYTALIAGGTFAMEMPLLINEFKNGRNPLHHNRELRL